MQPDSPSSGSGPERTSRDAVPTAASPDGAWLSPGLLRAAFVWTCERGRGQRELDVPAVPSALLGAHVLSSLWQRCPLRALQGYRQGLRVGRKRGAVGCGWLAQ